MKTSITIGAYRLVDFVRLNILRCRRIWGEDVNILISDDYSDSSHLIAGMATGLGCDYTVGTARRSHFSGDMQALVNSLVYGAETGSEISLKISQRLIPVMPLFREAMERAFEDERCQIVLPGRIDRRYIARPGSMFYSKFGTLSDVVGIRTGALDPEELLALYRERCKAADERKKPVSDSFAETTLGTLIDQKFPTSYKIIDEWTNHRQGQPKAYLRKSQSASSDYHQIASMEGMQGDFDLREWLIIEGRERYRPKADVV